jgi:hypothetical protein
MSKVKDTRHKVIFLNEPVFKKRNVPVSTRKIVLYPPVKYYKFKLSPEEDLKLRQRMYEREWFREIFMCAQCGLPEPPHNPPQK